MIAAKLGGSSASISISVQQEILPNDVGKPPRSKHRSKCEFFFFRVFVECMLVEM